MTRSIDIKVFSQDTPSHGTIFLNKDGLVYRVPPAVADSLRTGFIETLSFKSLPIAGDQMIAKATFELGSDPVVEFYDPVSKFEQPELVKNSIAEIVGSYDAFFHKLAEYRSELSIVFHKMRNIIKV